MTPDDPRHGQRAGYCTGCRCTPCTDAAARYERGRQLDLLSNRPRMVPAIGARRRAQALMALGHSWSEIGRHVGMERTNLRRFVVRDQELMTARLAARFVCAYDALSMRLPTAPGGRLARAIDEAREIAQSAGWPPPLAWEGIDIDDPTAAPDLGICADDTPDEVVVCRILGGDYSLAPTATPAERRAVVAAWTRATGQSLNQLERATGWNPGRYAQRRAGNDEAA